MPLTIELAPQDGASAERIEPRRPRISRREFVVVGGLCVVAVAVPAALALGLGSFSLPSVDDWAYRRAAETFAQTGSVALAGWTAMTLVGQLVWSWPFLHVLGGGGWGFATSTAVLTLVGVGSAYYVARRVTDRGRALVAVLLLVAAPGFASNTVTFMTDVPTTSSELLCIALGIAALDHWGWRRWARLLPALVVGVFGFAIREFALVAPLAVLLCAGLSDRGRNRQKYLTAGLVVLAVCGAIYLWWHQLPGGVHQPLLVPSTVTFVRACAAYFTLAFMVSPAVAVAIWRRRRDLAPRLAAAGAASVVLLALATDRLGGGVFVGDFLVRTGAVGTLLLGGQRPALFSDVLWDLISLVAVLSGVALAGLALGAAPASLRRWRDWGWNGPIGAVRIFALMFTFASGLYLLSTTMLWDRYLWPLDFTLGLLLLRGDPVSNAARRWAWGLAGLLYSLLALIAIALMLNTDAYAAARWRGGELAVAKGIPAGEVDAGFEWVGAHSRYVANLALHPAAPSYEPWYARIQPGFRECALVSGSQLTNHGLRLITVTTYRLYGFAGSMEHLYVYKVNGCARNPATPPTTAPPGR